MKYALIVGILVLSSGAFLNLVLSANTGGAATLQGDESLQRMWGVVDFAVVGVAFFHSRRLIRIASQQPWLLAFVAWSILSATWSVDPLVTARRTVGLACTLFFGFYLGAEFDMEDLLRMLAWALAIVLVASIVAGVLFPSLGIMSDLDGGAWRGVFLHKNVMARIVGLAIIVFAYLFWDSRRSRVVFLVPLFLGIVLLVLSRSMTAAAVVALTLALGMYRKLRLRPAESVALFAVGLLLGLAVTAYLQGDMDSVFALMGRNSSLTGRTQLWQFAAAAVLQRPLLGAGWDAFWGSFSGDSIRALVGWDAPHAHNAFIDLSLNIGLIGLGLFLAGLFDCFRRAIRYSRQIDRPFNLWPLLFLSYMFFYMFTETNQADRHSLFFVMYCAISVSLNAATAEQRVGQEEGTFPLGEFSNLQRY